MSARRSVSAAAAEFARRGRAGEKVRATVAPEHAVVFVRALIREGVTLANDCLDHIRDERMREAVKTMLMGAAGGACLGAALGAAIAGPAGAELGALVGAGMGFVAGIVAVVVSMHEGPDGRLVVSTC